MRNITDRVSKWPCGRYFFFWAGDELLMEATNDEDAIKEGEKLFNELMSEALGAE